MPDINVTISEADPINVTVGTDTIAITIDGGVSNNFVASDMKFYFNGNEGNTYLVYDSATSRLQLWVNGVKRAQWN